MKYMLFAILCLTMSGCIFVGGHDDSTQQYLPTLTIEYDEASETLIFRETPESDKEPGS